MEHPIPHLSSNSTEILERQKRAEAHRATGLKVREVARTLGCSPYVAQTLLNRANDKRLDAQDTTWLTGLSHRTARTLLAQGYKDAVEVARALTEGVLSSGAPGVGPKMLEELGRWIEINVKDQRC